MHSVGGCQQVHSAATCGHHSPDVACEAGCVFIVVVIKHVPEGLESSPRPRHLRLRPSSHVVRKGAASNSRHYWRCSADV